MNGTGLDGARRLVVRTNSIDESNVLVEVQDSGTGIADGRARVDLRALHHHQARRTGNGPFDLPLHHRTPRRHDLRLRTIPTAARSSRSHCPSAACEPRMRKPFVVISGLPGSGKTTLGRRLAPALNLVLIDKDDILDRLFEAKGVGNAAWRRALSRESDEILSKKRRDQLVRSWRRSGVYRGWQQTPGLPQTGSMLRRTTWSTFIAFANWRSPRTVSFKGDGIQATSMAIRPLRTSSRAFAS